MSKTPAAPRAPRANGAAPPPSGEQDQTAQAGNGQTETGGDDADDAKETGLKKAEDYLATIDEDVTLLWHVGGPKRSRIDRIGQFLVTPPGAVPVKLLCVAMASGGFQLYAPAQIAPAQPPQDAETGAGEGEEQTQQ